jgi:acetyl esterase/lipase
LAGDSAGGNLILALLSHILHPHPEIAPNKLSGKFAGVALLSPWVTFDTEKAASMRTNKVRDALAIPLLNQWSAAFQDGVPSDPYQEPLSAPNDWFKDLPVRNVLILAGADEIFVDDIAKFTDILRRVFPTVVSEITPDEAHDQLVMETTMKLPMSQQRTIFQNWISENCRIRESSSSKLTLMTVLLSYALVKKRLV